MDEYLIGAGAILAAGSGGLITPATLHAQTEPELAPRVGAALVDFEAARVTELSRLLVLAAGWSWPRFRVAVVDRLLERRDCSLADVVAALAEATGVSEVHLFAHWQPDDETTAALQERGICVVAHPIEAIRQAALVCGQRLERWRPPVRAA
jgi:hypothetical protein